MPFERLEHVPLERLEHVPEAVVLRRISWPASRLHLAQTFKSLPIIGWLAVVQWWYHLLVLVKTVVFVVIAAASSSSPLA